MAKIKIHYKKGGPSQLPALREAMKAPVNPQESLEEVIAELNAFERQYGITTIEFFARFNRGLMGDSRDFIKWAGLFQGYQHLMNKYFNPTKAETRSYTSEDMHRALFPKPPKARTLKEMKEGIQQHMKERHAGR